MNVNADEQTSSKDTIPNPPPVTGTKGQGIENASNKEAVASDHQATSEQGAQEIEQLTKDLADCKDRLLRNVAEMDNMRKRLEREKAEFIKFSSESILKDMIPILDSFDKALPPVVTDSETSDSKSFRDGMLMVQKQFLTALAKHGLEPVESVGRVFDPNFHQAIQRVEAEDATNETVATEFMKGYVLHGRLVRPAMVSVKVPLS